MIFSSNKRKKILNGKNEDFNCVESKGHGGGASGREKTFCPRGAGFKSQDRLGLFYFED